MNLSPTLSLLSACVVLGLSACSSNQVPPAPLAPFKPSTSVVRQWAVTDAALAAPSVVKAVSGTALLVPHSKDIAAYQADSGKLLWRTPLPNVEASVGVSADGKTVLALVQGVEAVALNAETGAVLWRNSLPAEMRVQPGFVGGVFVVLTADGRMVGLEESTGRRRWALARTLPALTVRGTGAVAAMSNTLAAVGLPGGKAVGVNVNNGQVVWETSLALTRGVNEVERIADVLPQWVSVPGLGLCATTYRQRVACVDDKGNISKTIDMSALSGLVVSGSQWFVLDDNGSVGAWTPKAGVANAAADKPDWAFDGFKGRMGSSPLAPVYEAWDPVSARPVAVVTVPVRPLSAESDARPGPADAQGLEQLHVQRGERHAGG